MRALAFPAIASVVMLLLAGCSSSDDDEPKLAADTYTLTLRGAPAIVSANSTFAFELQVDGDIERASDHVGAHFGNTSSQAPSTTVYASACAHQIGTVPSEDAAFTVTCKAPTKLGIYYLRGHVRIIEGNQTFNWWSAEHTFTVVV